MFMAKAEVEELTGYKKPSLQSKWLWEHNIQHLINAQGRVIVVRSALEQQQTVKADEPRFDYVA